MVNETEIRVRYGETDQMGVVYHGNYAVYFEIGRTEWLRQFGISYKEMEDNGIMLPVVSLEVKYKKSATYDDVLRVRTSLKKLPTATIEFDYQLVNQNDEVLSLGNTRLVFIDMKKNRPMRCPSFIMDKLEK
ncbi:MAG: thioesterase [Bacteroidetes bacterium MedPE-SWsnd-G2]|nr:MAG: thioesterase [Bacteroidetes bacterium MedPE-SWsnd-G2]